MDSSLLWVFGLIISGFVLYLIIRTAVVDAIILTGLNRTENLKGKSPDLNKNELMKDE